jgi:adenine-specific DNA-methyltransferase
MNNTVKRIESILTSAFSADNYTVLVREIFPGVKITGPNLFRKEYSNYSSHIESSAHVGIYTDPNGKTITIHSVQLKKESYVENSRSTQRSYAKRLIEAGNADAAIIAFFTAGDTKWRLSFVRLEYELKIENGKLNTKENLTPAKRFSYLVGVDEPCHTAISRFFRFISDDPNINAPSLDDIEDAFSVEKVTKEFFELYCEKFHQLREALEANEDFVIEAEQHNFTSAQFAKKLMGQIVFLYFLQKKGWLGVSAWPRGLDEKAYKNAFFARGAKSRELIPKVYYKADNNRYILSGKAVKELSDEDETLLASCVKGDPWGSGSKVFMRRIFELAKKDNVNFFDSYLEPLFYNALNVNRGEQGYDPALHCRIPFLSGGLFEPIDGYDWEHNDFAIPNELFSNKDTKGERDADGILDIFDRYNFTMSEDEPMEKEVAIDPEMLGKVFENLLEVQDRKSKGAFYTPREIVHYMCQEALISYLINETALKEQDIRDFILLGDFLKDEDTSKDKRQGDNAMLISEEIFKIDSKGNVVVNRLKDIDDALANIRIADPAVGSGAFPLGMLNEIVRARQNISAYMAITMNSFETRRMYNNERSPYVLKLQTIKNCIFAADIEPSAVDIAQLRLWLSLVIDDEINPNADSPLDGHKNPIPLPNLECNIVCGDSLVDEFEGHQLINYSSIIATSRENQQQNLFRDAFEAILPALIEAQDALFRCDNTAKKQEYKRAIESLTNEIVKSQFQMASESVWERYLEARKVASKPFVLWQLNFARVFKEKGGFDIVIGNPPYVQLSKTEGVPEEYKSYLRRRFGTSGGRLNLFIFMIHKGLELLNANGTISYIIPNTIMTQDYYKDTRKSLIFDHTLLSLVDYQDMPFEHAVVENITFFASNQPQESYSVRVHKGTTSQIKYVRSINIDKFRKAKNYAFSIDSNDFIDGLFEDATPLKALCNINQAIALKGDKSISVKDDYESGYYKLLDGRNIGKYGINWTGKYLDYSLDRIHSCKRKDIFEADEKLLFRRVSSTLIATYDNEQYFALNTLVVMTPKVSGVNLKYILALFNSKLMNYVYRNKFKSTKTVFSEIQARSVGELPIRDSVLIDEVVTIVDEILRIKRTDFNADCSTLERRIDDIVYRIYDVSEEQKLMIEDSLDKGKR